MSVGGRGDRYGNGRHVVAVTTSMPRRATSFTAADGYSKVPPPPRRSSVNEEENSRRTRRVSFEEVDEIGINSSADEDVDLAEIYENYRGRAKGSVGGSSTDSAGSRSCTGYALQEFHNLTMRDKEFRGNGGRNGAAAPSGSRPDEARMTSRHRDDKRHVGKAVAHGPLDPGYSSSFRSPKTRQEMSAAAARSNGYAIGFEGRRGEVVPNGTARQRSAGNRKEDKEDYANGDRAFLHQTRNGGQYSVDSSIAGTGTNGFDGSGRRRGGSSVNGIQQQQRSTSSASSTGLRTANNGGFNSFSVNCNKSSEAFTGYFGTYRIGGSGSTVSESDRSRPSPSMDASREGSTGSQNDSRSSRRQAVDADGNVRRTERSSRLPAQGRPRGGGGGGGGGRSDEDYGQIEHCRITRGSLYDQCRDSSQTSNGNAGRTAGGKTGKTMIDDVPDGEICRCCGRGRFDSSLQKLKEEQAIVDNNNNNNDSSGWSIVYSEPEIPPSRPKTRRPIVCSESQNKNGQDTAGGTVERETVVRSGVDDSSWHRPTFRASVDLGVEFAAPTARVGITVDKGADKIHIEAEAEMSDTEAADDGDAGGGGGGRSLENGPKEQRQPSEGLGSAASTSAGGTRKRKKTLTQKISMPRFTDDTKVQAKMNDDGWLEIEIPLIFYFPPDKLMLERAARARSYIYEVRPDPADPSLQIMEIVVAPGNDIRVADVRVDVADRQLIVSAPKPKTSSSGFGLPRRATAEEAKECDDVIKQYALPVMADVDGIASRKTSDGLLVIKVPLRGTRSLR